ncbi:hypothetical protein [Planctellipticum variicoloris]|jgi:hypothetical protein|uniref:hypothetical protein n=1 Tax=Planctellipticum variicoloris TaxID=3064265 RepID=UPI0030139285|nr:hypothetical protein SH412_003176 [Planctomycetaceae bacterium SH412]
MNDDTASWKTMLLLELGLSSLGIVAFWIHAKWRKRVAADQWRWRRWAAGISLIAFEVALLSFVGISRLLWWTHESTLLPLDAVLLDRWMKLFPRLVRVLAIVIVVTGSVLIGVMGAPVADATAEA